MQIAAEGPPAIAFRPTGATKLLRDLPAPVQESVASVPNSLTSGWEAQGSLPRGELPLEQDLIDCRCLLISRTCSLLPVCAGTRPRTRTHTEPPLLPQSPKHSLGDGSRTTSRYALRSTVPRRTFLFAALLRESRHAQRRERSRARTAPATAVGAPRWPQASAWEAGRPQRGARGRLPLLDVSRTGHPIHRKSEVANPSGSLIARRIQLHPDTRPPAGTSVRVPLITPWGSSVARATKLLGTA